MLLGGEFVPTWQALPAMIAAAAVSAGDLILARPKIRLPASGVRAADKCGPYVIIMANPSRDLPLDRPRQMMEARRV